MADVANEAPSEAPEVPSPSAPEAELPKDILDLVRDVAQAAPSVSIAPAEAAPEAAPLPVVEEAKVEEKTTPDWLPMLKSQPSTKRGFYEKQTDRLKAALGPAPKTPAVQSAHDLDVRGKMRQGGG